jgi:hypothetical protein
LLLGEVPLALRERIVGFCQLTILPGRGLTSTSPQYATAGRAGESAANIDGNNCHAGARASGAGAHIPAVSPRPGSRRPPCRSRAPR